ncbi:MAG TPA: divergent PAP2 family protein [Anaerolineales bacterium]|nr:divergent PAP2 family protein [Anaerolineales bacterium]
MNLLGVFSNPILIAGFSAWSLAQIIKVPLFYLTDRELDWTLLLRAGGMPSSHSALVAGTAHAIGLFIGFDTPLFALAVAVAIIVIYDATGIRRQAGKHAEIINAMVRDLTSGHPLREEQLREVLGHTPLEALGGTLLGLLIAQLLWFVWL